MIYEYHLEDGTIELSNEPNITSFERVVYDCWDDELQQQVTDYIDVAVRFCIIKDE